MDGSFSPALDTAVDNLFTNILGSDGDKIEYYQAKIDFAFDKLLQHPKRIDYRIYKLYVAQALLSYQRLDFQAAADEVELAMNALGGNQMQRAYQSALEKLVNSIQEHNNRSQRKMKVRDARQSFIQPLVYAILLFIGGGILTGITYAMAKPGGTYWVTSGLFLVGGINLIISAWRFLKWLAIAAKHRSL